MARALRVEYEGAIYHVTARGNERNPIFRSDEDRRFFIKKLAFATETHHIRLYAYVLMTNHYHFLLETPRANLSAFMHQFNTTYTVYFNRRYERSGHLFGGRYKAKLVEGDPYLLKLTRYLHANPVKTKEMANKSPAEAISFLSDYPWSTFPAYIGKVPKDDFVDYAPLSLLIKCDKKQKLGNAYRKYIELGLAETDAEFHEILNRSSKAIGSDLFCQHTEELYREQAQKGCPLDVAFRRVEIGTDSQRIISAICNHFQASPDVLTHRRSTDPARLLVAKLLNEEAGLTQRNIAKTLGLSDGSSISRLLKKADQSILSNRSLNEAYIKIKTAIHNH